jgi:hypothetical protein
MSECDWDKIDEPFLEIDGFIDIILDKINILDILDKWGIKYSACRTGEFTHRMKCPFPSHAGGNERTASFFVSEDTGGFYCFGCNNGGNVINMVSLHDGRPFYESAKWLAKTIGLINNDNTISDLNNIPSIKEHNPEHKVSTHIFRTGVKIREFLYSIKSKIEYDEWKQWADTQFIKLDKYLDELDNDDWKIAKDYYNEVVEFLKRT